METKQKLANIQKELVDRLATESKDMDLCDAIRSLEILRKLATVDDIGRQLEELLSAGGEFVGEVVSALSEDKGFQKLLAHFS
jgi:hypothetical protein